MLIRDVSIIPLMEWISKLSETFKNGVERLCFPDTGVIFSAGVDSALAAYVASDYMKLTAYTVGIEGLIPENRSEEHTV